MPCRRSRVRVPSSALFAPAGFGRGDVAKLANAAVCKTVIHRFESGRRLLCSDAGFPANRGVSRRPERPSVIRSRPLRTARIVVSLAHHWPIGTGARCHSPTPVSATRSPGFVPGIAPHFEPLPPELPLAQRLRWKLPANPLVGTHRANPKPGAAGRRPPRRLPYPRRHCRPALPTRQPNPVAVAWLSR